MLQCLYDKCLHFPPLLLLHEIDFVHIDTSTSHAPVACLLLPDWSTSTKGKNAQQQHTHKRGEMHKKYYTLAMLLLMPDLFTTHWATSLVPILFQGYFTKKTTSRNQSYFSNQTYNILSKSLFEFRSSLKMLGNLTCS